MFSFQVESYMEPPIAPEDVPVTDESLWKHTSSETRNSITTQSSSSTSQTRPSVLLNLCQKTRLHILILAVIVRILLTLPCAVLFGEVSGASNISYNR